MSPFPVSLVPVVVGLAILATAAAPLRAQSQTEMKIRLMGEALAARDKGDLPAAKAQLERLQAIAPGDPEIARLLTQVNERIAAAQVPAAPVVSPAAPAPEPRIPPPPGVMPAVTDERAPAARAPAPGPRPEAAAAEAAVQNLLRAGDEQLGQIAAYVEAQRALARAQAEEGNFTAAMQTLDEALAALKKPAADVRAERANYRREYVERYLEAQKGVRLRHRR